MNNVGFLALPSDQIVDLYEEAYGKPVPDLVSDELYRTYRIRARPDYNPLRVLQDEMDGVEPVAAPTPLIPLAWLALQAYQREGEYGYI